MNRNGWTYKRLGEVCDLITDGSHNPPKGVDHSSYRMISSQNVFDDMLVADDTNVRYLSEEDYERENKRTRLSENVVLLTIVGAIGRSCVLKDSDKFLTLQRSVAALHPSTSMVSRYLMHCLIGNRKVLENEAHGAAQKGIYLKQLASLNIPIPPKETQYQIVEELDSLNDSITMLQQQVKDLDTLAQSLFYDMFGDPITNPKGWEVKNLSEIGQIVAGSTPSTADESNWDGAVNWVTPAELGEQLYYGETVRKLTEKGAKGLTLMPVGTVLLSSRAPIGKLAITTVPMCCNQGFKNIICNNTTNNIFLYYFLFLTMEHVKALGRGATFKEVSKSAISTYKVILPPLSLQQAFADRITAIEESKASLSAQISELQNLLASRMQYWFD